MPANVPRAEKKSQVKMRAREQAGGMGQKFRDAA